jgi:thiol-disulfide isomerase/thioredoxin
LFVLLSGCSDRVLQLSNGDKQALSELRGQWLLINYWAQWCRPCLEEIPELNTLDKRPDLRVLGLDYDKAQGDELTNKAKRLGIEYALILTDPAPLFSQQPPSGLPATMLINKEGKFVRWLMGPQTIESIQRAIRK